MAEPFRSPIPTGPGVQVSGRVDVHEAGADAGLRRGDTQLGDHRMGVAGHLAIIRLEPTSQRPNRPTEEDSHPPTELQPGRMAHGEGDGFEALRERRGDLGQGPYGGAAVVDLARAHPAVDRRGRDYQLPRWRHQIHAGAAVHQLDHPVRPPHHIVARSAAGEAFWPAGDPGAHDVWGLVRPRNAGPDGLVVTLHGARSPAHQACGTAGTARPDHARRSRSRRSVRRATEAS
jgi:hypothetical protein